jgi:hypothetical protein
MNAMRKLQSGRSGSVMIMLSGAAAVHMPIAPRSGKLVLERTALRSNVHLSGSSRAEGLED